ncbi:hypothetical protein BDY21DRAFT_284273, partial [Lineolata rhizophorae]
LGQELHVLFILVILCTTIIFCHSLIRLCMLAIRPQSALADEENQQPRIPSMTGPEGFHPIRPIRVHLARDEEIANGEDDEGAAREGAETAEKGLMAPPPAYGLWRSSVRVDPNLLHWQRNPSVSSESAPGAAAAAAAVESSSGSAVSASPRDAAPDAASSRPRPELGPRPPSYASDDGVDYVVEAAPRSTVIFPSRPGSGVHPAWRV